MAVNREVYWCIGHFKRPYEVKDYFPQWIPPSKVFRTD